MITYLFKIPEKIFKYFLNLIWILISKILNNLWDNHMISISDYYNIDIRK